MIPVRRTEKPDVLNNNAERWLRKLQEVKYNPAATKAQIDNAMNKYRHQKIKQALVSMFHGKCAYCESNTQTGSYGDIEHFRPKSNPEYLHLTFEWNNLLLSCNRCNDAKHKGTRFPLDRNGNPLLVDPTDEETDPFAHLKFSWAEGQVLVEAIDDRGNAIIDIFDLNNARETRNDLFHQRREYVEMLVFYREIAMDESITASKRAKAIALLKESCQPTAEYSAFALFLILPYLAHYFRDPEAIALMEKMGRRSAAYRNFVSDYELP